MAVRIAINGFGRIGRNILRAIVESGRTDIQVVAVNDLGPVETNAHLLRYDSVHGRFPHEVVVDGDTIRTAGHTIKVTAVRDPAELLAADGTIDYGETGNPIYDVYTLRGHGTETWHPQFEYHGMRYLQLEGLPSAPTSDTVHLTVLRAANERAGTFSCSDQLLDDIHRIIDRRRAGAAEALG